MRPDCCHAFLFPKQVTYISNLHFLPKSGLIPAVNRHGYADNAAQMSALNFGKNSTTIDNDKHITITKLLRYLCNDFCSSDEVSCNQYR